MGGRMVDKAVTLVATAPLREESKEGSKKSNQAQYEDQSDALYWLDCCTHLRCYRGHGGGQSEGEAGCEGEQEGGCCAEDPGCGEDGDCCSCLSWCEGNDSCQCDNCCTEVCGEDGDCCSCLSWCEG